jgi:DNA repair protein RecN (Recombination protein N)
VTHAPQARADQHPLISKDALDKARVATRVATLAKDHRREEIARMLAGAEITAEARAAADRLLKAATGDASWLRNQKAARCRRQTDRDAGQG